MVRFSAAVKKEPALRLLHNLLSERNHRPLRFEIGETSFFRFKVGCEIDPVLSTDPSFPYGVDISSDGAITAFFRANVYASWIEFQFDVNSVWPSGKSVGFICAKKKFGLCILWLPLYMPNLQTITFRINSIPRVPLMSLDVSFAVESLATGGLVDPDSRNLHARFLFLRSGAYKNDYGFEQMLSNMLFETIENGLPGGLIGQILQHVAGFVRRIVETILGKLQFVQSWLNFVASAVHNKLVSECARLFTDDPSVSIKVGRLPARQVLAPEAITPTGHRQPAVYLGLERVELDINTDCSTGPELRLNVTVN